MIQNKTNRWIGGVLLFPLILILLGPGTTIAQSSANYKMQKDVLDSGGALSISTNFKLEDAAGQPSAIGNSSSTDYMLLAGYLGAFEEVVQPQHFTFTPNTGDSYSIVVTAATINAASLAIGDEIGVFTPAGLCVGVSVWNGTAPLALIAWIDDSQTPQVVDGYKPGEIMSFKIWEQSSNNEYSATPTYSQGNGAFGDGAFASVSLAAVISATTASIKPDAPPTAQCGEEFWVAVVVGDPDPVTDLFGVSFDLNYPTTYIDYVSAQSTNPGTGAGNVLGGDLVFIATPNDASGTVSVGVSRKSGQGGVSGSGSIVWIKFISLVTTPDPTDVTWSLSNITANDASGNTMTFTPATANTTIRCGCKVWPGDTNNDGVVTAADVLPIGLHFGKTGPTRSGASLSWAGQIVTCWTPEAATYADANGNGRVGAEEILAIGLNWGKTHTSSVIKSLLSKTQSTAAVTIQPVVTWASGDSFRVDIQVTDVTDLFGIAFDLVYTADIADVEALGVATDPFIGTDLIFFSQINISTKTVNVGLSRKAGQGGVSGNGKVASIYFKGNLTSPAGTVVNFGLQNITANDANGTAIAFTPATGNFVTDVESTPGESNAVPETFELSQNYPNPFNPTTTINFTVPRKYVGGVKVSLKIYNIQGQKVRSLVDADKSPGLYSVIWDGKNDRSELLPSGVYFYTVSVGEFKAVRKMMFLK